MTPLLRVEHLRKVFPSPRATDAEGFIAVDDVSFALPPGGSLAVVGESGSGKTTVARMIAGLETPTFGLIGYDGTARATGRAHHRERRTRAREVQMVFQDPYTSLDPHQSVAAAIGEILRVHFPEESAHHGERVQQLLQQVGLDERQGAARPRALSGGQRQRAAIARALALRRPRLLILDEAVAALDVSVQAQIINLLADLRRWETGSCPGPVRRAGPVRCRRRHRVSHRAGPPATDPAGRRCRRGRAGRRSRR
ncbi:ATP-binding cassette domain-containing protein [Streptomyces cynarae]|uniref:ATP-binding cassette domain-containing protein n=1 Tax=Streptomyces cynarae TaxID=2981134 RepID=A0ABY6ECB6_9ACTN|nr:ATP-binding cassette domain-containing protein [Streptomyces cynarae]UXY24322.1 ATP-binding cassette domain-containing protein [Streptomyces cynarae]